MGRTALLEMSPPVLERALESFSGPVRTLDAVHLASIDFLIRGGIRMQLASYDRRMISLAGMLGFEVMDLGKL